MIQLNVKWNHMKTMCGMMIAVWFLYYPIYYIYIQYFQYSIIFYMYNIVGNDSNDTSTNIQSDRCTEFSCFFLSVV